MGDQMGKAWEAALENMSQVHPRDRNEIIDVMIKAGPLVEITCKHILQNAVKAGFLRVVAMYDPYKKTGPTLALNPDCDSDVFTLWNERPPKKVDRFKRARAAARREKNPNSDNYDPIAARYDV